MLSSTPITFLLAAASLAAASPTIRSRQDSDPTLVIFKTYADASNCRNGQGSDTYSNMVFGTRSEAVSGDCMTFDAVGTVGGGTIGWAGLKAIAHYATDFNVTAYAYTTSDCVDTGDNKAMLFDSVCNSASSNYLSWNFVKW